MWLFFICSWHYLANVGNSNQAWKKMYIFKIAFTCNSKIAPETKTVNQWTELSKIFSRKCLIQKSSFLYSCYGRCLTRLLGLYDNDNSNIHGFGIILHIPKAAPWFAFHFQNVGKQL